MLVLVTTLLPSHSTPPENIIQTSKWLAGIEYSRLDKGHLLEYAEENMVDPDVQGVIDHQCVTVCDGAQTESQSCYLGSMVWVAHDLRRKVVVGQLGPSP